MNRIIASLAILALIIPCLAGTGPGPPGKKSAARLIPFVEDTRNGHVDSHGYLDGLRVGYMDQDGKTVIKPQFADGKEFCEGLAPACYKEKKWGYIDASGKFIIKPQFSDADHFSEGLAAVELPSTRKYGFIDKTGKFAIPPRFDYAESFSEGLAIVQMVGSDLLYINKSGKTVLRFNRDSNCSSFHEELAATQLHVDSYWGYIDKTGKFAIAPKFEHAKAFSEGLAAVDIDAEYGYIDKTGKLVIEPRFAQTIEFSEGLAAVAEGVVQEDEDAAPDEDHPLKWGYIDRTGKYVIEPRFTLAGRFIGGRAYVLTEHREGCIDRSGKFLWNQSLLGSGVVRLLHP